ncbi:MAG: methylmalonyl Co-A mutase-associated GTPase MeaB [Desulfurococcales archaeon]|nr:methylmalonyl Co-A mutase-associated GTPase MeaB [Desulfurococcales archaeon]
MGGCALAGAALPGVVEDLLRRALEGQPRALGRLLSLLERPGPLSARLLERLTPRARGSQVVGFTGIPGAGKSTLVSRVIGELRRRGYRVAVVAIDPTSPLSQGALMGDRLRMQEHSTDPGVFIRSISTRGLRGGLSLAALTLVEAFDALGYDKIIIETVGVGQAEVDIMHAAHTIVVVTMPGAGDDIQALKAGVMEIGDIYVVNKSDKPEATKTYEYMSFALEKGDIGRQGGWAPRLVRTSAVMGQGVRELVDAIEEHWEYVNRAGLRWERVYSRRSLLVRLTAERLLAESLEEIAGARRGELLEVARRGSGFLEEALRLAGEACGEVRGLLGEGEGQG